MLIKKFLSAASIVFALALLTSTTNADNWWGTYHWARTTGSFDLTVVNSTTSDWDGYVSQSISDWSSPIAPWTTYLTMVEDPNGGTSKKTRRQCKAPDGQVRICNLAYGQTGWLGVAGIYIDAADHIVKAYTKLNDTYFAWDFYNNDAWKQSVTCQELGHNIGLSHNDADFYNEPTGTCMDYSSDPELNQHPNDHDYEQLEIIYGHIDGYDSYLSGTSDDPDGGTEPCNAPPGKGCNKSGVGNNGDSGFGMSLSRRGQVETFIRIGPDGTRLVTFVTWAIGY